MDKKKPLTKNIINAVKKYAEYIKTKGVMVEKVIIFGSYAQGTNKSDSDIDVCIVSKNFGKDEIKELQLLLRLATHVDDRIEPLAIKPQELNNQYNSLSMEINRRGLRVM